MLCGISDRPPSLTFHPLKDISVASTSLPLQRCYKHSCPGFCGEVFSFLWTKLSGVRSLGSVLAAHLACNLQGSSVVFIITVIVFTDEETDISIVVDLPQITYLVSSRAMT